jgi:hypothetical protein
VFLISTEFETRKDSEMQPSTNDALDLVKQRAYELWEQQGRPEGYDMEFWSQAERELQVEGSNADSSMAISANASTAKSGSGSDGPSGH